MNKRSASTVPPLDGGAKRIADEVRLPTLLLERFCVSPDLEGMMEEGMALPVSAPIEQHKSDPDFAGGVWALVEVDMSCYEGRAEKINITLPRYLLRRIDDAAKLAGSSRSGFLADAARKAMMPEHVV